MFMSSRLLFLLPWAQTLLPHFFKAFHSQSISLRYIIFPLIPRSSTWCLSFNCPHKNPVCSPFPCVTHVRTFSCSLFQWNKRNKRRYNEHHLWCHVVAWNVICKTDAHNVRKLTNIRSNYTLLLQSAHSKLTNIRSNYTLLLQSAHSPHQHTQQLYTPVPVSPL